MADQYLTITQAQQRAGVALGTLRDRIRRGEIVVHTNPRDRRSHLVAVEDLERLLTPHPIRTEDSSRVPAA